MQDDTSAIYFMLHCQKFIELVRVNSSLLNLVDMLQSINVLTFLVQFVKETEFNYLMNAVYITMRGPSIYRKETLGNLHWARGLNSNNP